MVASNPSCIYRPIEIHLSENRAPQNYLYDSRCYRAAREIAAFKYMIKSHYHAFPQTIGQLNNFSRASYTDLHPYNTAWNLNAISPYFTAGIVYGHRINMVSSAQYLKAIFLGSSRPLLGMAFRFQNANDTNPINWFVPHRQYGHNMATSLNPTSNVAQ